jgi:hypothetical protein
MIVYATNRIVVVIDFRALIVLVLLWKFVL